MNRQEVVRKLREKVYEAESNQLIAEEIGVTPECVSQILRGIRNPGKKVLKYLGLKKQVIYVEDEND